MEHWWSNTPWTMIQINMREIDILFAFNKIKDREVRILLKKDESLPHMWEMLFWPAILDRMANVLPLWSLSLFPPLGRIPEFSEACIDDEKVSTRCLCPPSGVSWMWRRSAA